jgi:DNA-binding MarR family transcriptional regulator
LARLHRLLESVDSGLTLPQYRVLAGLAQGGVRSAHLAEHLSVRRPTLTAIADGLVAAGYAARQSEAGDRRVVRLCATDAGRAALARADEAYLAKLDPLLAEIPHAGRLVADLLVVGDALDARLTAKLPSATPPSTTPPSTTPPSASPPSPPSPNPAAPSRDTARAATSPPAASPSSAKPPVPVRATTEASL